MHTSHSRDLPCQIALREREREICFRSLKFFLAEQEHGGGMRNLEAKQIITLFKTNYSLHGDGILWLLHHKQNVFLNKFPTQLPPHTHIITRWHPSHLCKQAVKQAAWITHFSAVWVFQVQRLIGFLGIITAFPDTVREFCLEKCKDIKVETLMELRNQSFHVYSSQKSEKSITTTPHQKSVSLFLKIFGVISSLDSADLFIDMICQGSLRW